MDLTSEEAVELQKQIKDSRRLRRKESISKQEPFKHSAGPSKRRASGGAYVQNWRKGAPPATNEERLEQIEKQIEVTSKLPRSSSYARHRLKVLETAKRLLQAG